MNIQDFTPLTEQDIKLAEAEKYSNDQGVDHQVFFNKLWERINEKV